MTQESSEYVVGLKEAAKRKKERSGEKKWKSEERVPVAKEEIDNQQLDEVGRLVKLLKEINPHKEGLKTFDVRVEEIMWLSQFGRSGAGHLTLRVSSELSSVEIVSASDTPPVIQKGDRLIVITEDEVLDDIKMIDEKINALILLDEDGQQKMIIFKDRKLQEAYKGHFSPLLKNPYE